MKAPKLLAMILGLSIAVSASSEIYQWTDTKGQTHFSESLPKDLQNAKNVRRRDDSNLPGITTMDAQDTSNYNPSNYTRHVQQTNTDADWNTCADTKRRAVYLEKQREVHESEKLNDWLWQNCRGYSNELRAIEQQMM